MPFRDIFFPSRCSCEDCEAAVSPGAYLVDLLDYILKHVTRSGARIDFAYLYEKFHQPFSDLALSCESVEEQIRQVRICVEVLRSALESRSSDPTDSELLVAEKNYRLATYSGILTKIGTSLQEIRAARRQDDEERKKIGDRLAIPVSEDREALPQGDPLDRLFLDPGVGTDDNSSAIPEQDLEILFGLVDTNRDILSTGAKINDGSNQILRWQLEGVQWNQNTDPEGKIYLTLNRSEDRTEISLYQDKDATRILLAEGQITTPGGEITVRSVVNESELSGRFQVTDMVDTPTDNPIEIELSVVPLYLSWRLQYLRTLWQKQDWIEDDYSQRQLPIIDPAQELLPIIDPDIIGPDDFRHPYADNEDGTFQIWVNRRQWVDERLQELESDRFLGGTPPSPNLITIFNHMYDEEISYGGSSFPAAWQDSTPVSEFPELLQTLATGNQEEIDEVRDRIESNLNLTVESFTHLMEIYETDQQAKRDTRAEPVTEEAWQELFSILVQAKKESLYSNWVREETRLESRRSTEARDIKIFGPRSFWISVREPVEGNWSGKLAEFENRPLIDPELLGLEDLPEPTAGRRARRIWNTRTNELKEDLGELKRRRETASSPEAGFANILRWAFGRRYDLDDLLTQLGSIDDTEVKEAERQIKENLSLTVENFRRLMNLKQKNESGTEPLTSTEWNEVYAILNTAHKKLSRYPDWIDRENRSNYWHLIKAKLPKWRSSSEARQAWKIALQQRSQPPLIDPDLIDTGHLDTPLSNNPAYEIWNLRHQELTEQFTTLQDKPENSSDNLSWLRQALTTILDLDEITASELFTELSDTQAEGNSITARLAQYGLTNASFAYLNRIVELLENDPTAPILDSEWESVDNILVQLWKQRQFAEWLAEEKESGLILSPDYFVIPEPAPFTFPLPEPTPLKEWRASRQALNQWEDDLQARIDQQENAENALAEAISAIEEETLPVLRDALIKEVDTEEGDLKQKAERLADRLQIDTQDSGCRVTTRIGQAIETLQTFLWSHRTGQLGAEFTDLDEFNHAEFDEEWKWLGSYATWRAAIFVYIYPENVLIPSLKRWQTPAFRNLVKELRTNRRLTPEQACAAANRYSDYLRDIANLEVEATCEAETVVSNEDCSDRDREDKRKRPLLHLFAISTVTNNIYWSTYDPNKTEPDYAQSFWRSLPEFQNVINIIGAVPYAINTNQRFIFLFVKIQDGREQKLVFGRINLESGIWDGQVNELDLPEDATGFSAVVKQSQSSLQVPQLAIQVTETNIIYLRSLDFKGTDWEDEDFQIINQPYLRYEGKFLIESLHAMVAVNQEDYFLIGSDFQGNFWFRILGQYKNHIWDIIFISESYFGGAFSLFDSNRLFVVLSLQSNSEIKLTLTFLPPQRRVELNINSATSLNNWLVRNIGISLNNIVEKNENNLEEFAVILLQNLLSDNPGARAFDLSDNNTFRIYIKDFLNDIVDDDSELAQQWRWAINFFDESSNFSLLNEYGSRLEQMIVEFVYGNSPLGGYSIFLYELEPFLTSHQSNLPKGLGKISPHSADYYERDSLSSSLSLRTSYQITDIQTVPKLLNINLNSEDEQLILQQSLNLIPTFYNPSIQRVAPTPDAPFDISEYFNGELQQARAVLLRAIFEANFDEPLSIWTYLEEAYYFVPMQIALQLQKRGHYVKALDWYRTIYDYGAALGRRKIYPRLRSESLFIERYSRPENWLLDPLNMHEIARSRPGTYTRFTLMSIIRCFFDYADSEFTLDTNESVAKARELYTTALELLKLPDLDQSVGQCSDVIAELETEVGSRIADEALERLSEWRKIVQLLQKISNPEQLNEVRQQILVNTSAQIPWSEKLNSIRKVIAAATPPANAPQQIGVVLQEQERSLAQAQTALLVDTNTAMTIMEASSGVKNRVSSAIANATNGNSNNLPWLRNNELANRLFEESFIDSETINKISDTLIRPYTPILKFSFCIPPNPVLNSLKLYGELNLYKIRTCRNFAGMERQLEPYSAATDTVSGLPQIGAGGQLVLPGANRLLPTIYRFETLIERAKQLVQYANQVEASLLSAIEKRDAESYNQLTARQQIKLSREGIRLQTLRVRAAESEVDLAELQQERAQIQVDYYEGLLEQDLLSFEKAYIGLMSVAAIFQGTSAVRSFKNLDIEAGLSFSASAASTSASLFQTLASYERRKQEWEFQSKLAQQDVRIGAQNVKLAEDRVRIVGQERKIAEIQTDHAKETLDFLTNKFTNVEFYDWMSDVLEGVYSLILQQGTATSKLAEIQLAFERQEVPPAFIQNDYWNATNDEAALGTLEGNAPDRRGLIGSARLLQDIVQLDQYAFENNQRKLQLTKTISLAQLSPAEFQRFRETGVLLFSTPMELFDHDFPGHYLRLIQRVRTSVIALIPPTQGIKATLISTGASRVTIGGIIFQTVNRNIGPQVVALSSPQEATGLFELQPQSELLLPFEGLGVDTSWEFRMPKAANQFDFNTIADVLITLDYTALDNSFYRQQVLQELDNSFSADRTFSFRNEFADRWYDLNNPEQTITPMVVRFQTRREDFPPNLDNLRIQQITLYFARANGITIEIPVTNLRFTEQNNVGIVEGGANSIDGIISTRIGNAASWTAMIGKSPIGEWELALLENLTDGRTTKDLFQNEEIEDILFVITYSGQTPEWPE